MAKTKKKAGAKAKAKPKGKAPAKTKAKVKAKAKTKSKTPAKAKKAPAKKVVKASAKPKKKSLGAKLNLGISPALINRDPKFKKDDATALQALCQAAVNVELFTIPLYMNSMYSIYGMHAIKGADFYQGRLWPGLGPVDLSKVDKSDPSYLNKDAFNKIFGVFIAEMLHLQLASNIANASGVHPTFTSDLLVNKNYGWTCYGPEETVIPHVVDFNDCIPELQHIRVNLGTLTKAQNELFVQIEQTEDYCRDRIAEENKYKYFPPVPFEKWKAGDSEKNLPMFGSIGYMYECLWQYMNITYSDKTKLWDIVYRPGSLQQDLFNMVTQYHPKKEYPVMSAIVQDSADIAKLRIWNMINAITDQGEGKGVAKLMAKKYNFPALQGVKPWYRPDDDALLVDNGAADVSARGGANGKLDHLEIFELIDDIIDQAAKAKSILTWDQWHDPSVNPNNVFTPEMLKTSAWVPEKNVPDPADVAGALNRLKANDSGTGANYEQVSQASCGAIAGITTVLNDFWSNMKTAFPFPSMGGSGDRVSICWAIFGKGPDLSIGIPAQDKNLLYHACQGMDLGLNSSNDDPNQCAGIEVYHTCKGSNSCKAQGGCGFVQSSGGGSNCSHTVLKFQRVEGNCGRPTGKYTAPSDNKCASFGGCAVPISASQLYPTPNPNTTTMEMITFEGPEFKSVPFGIYPYKVGDSVYDTAWAVYEKVLQKMGKPVPPKPKPSDFRLAFPPST